MATEQLQKPNADTTLGVLQQHSAVVPSSEQLLK